MRHFSHLNTAVQLIEQYKGQVPFSIFIRSFFAQHKKYGSKDRRRISQLCYCCFRLGHAWKNAATQERILTGLFLCNDEPDELLSHFHPAWNPALSLDEKIAALSFPVQDIFPWKDILSNGIDHDMFCRSFLVQPNLFLRLRPGQERHVRQQLQQASIPFDEVATNCLALPNATKIEGIIELDKEAVVQDMNSQATGSFFTAAGGPSHPAVWDCCAASGGKSILAHDLIKNIDLTVSDIRPSIIHNLKKRFATAGIGHYKSLVIDLAKDRHNFQFSTLNIEPSTINPAPSYDLIICDAPCSGSGTWSRTPEQLLLFNSAGHYAALQKKIVSNAIPHLKKGGRFVYITCSVFKQENEEAVAFIQQQFALRLERMEVLKGYGKKADTLFAASFGVD